MRSGLFLVLAMLGAVTSVRADERTARPPTPADEVLDALRADDEARLAALARRDDPCPWIVADALAHAGEHDAATRFALAAPRPDTARLPAYLAERRLRGETDAVRAALARADAAEGDEATRLALAALDEQVLRGDAFERTRVDVARATLLERLGRRAEAAEAFIAGGRTAERLGWLRQAAEAFEAAGLAAFSGMHFDLVVGAWKQLLDVQEGRANQDGVAQATMFLGGAHLEMGDLGRGQRLLMEAQRLYARLGSDDGLAWALNNVALAHSRLGHYEQEKAALEQALDLAQRVGNEYRVACVKVDLGTAHAAFGEFDRAKELYLQSMALFEGLENAEGIVQCQGNIGHLHLERKEYDEAVRWIELALENARALNDTAFICTATNALGWAWMHKGDLERARVLEEEAVELAHRLGDAWNEAHALQSLAAVLVRLKRFAEAERHLDESLRIGAQLDSSLLLMTGHRDQAELWLARGDFARAVFASQRGLEHSLRHLAGLSQRSSAAARSRLGDLYAAAIRAAAGFGKPRALFTALEATRAGALLETLENRDAIRAASIPQALLEEERRARLDARVAVHEFQQALAGGDLPTIRRRREGLTRSRDAVDRAIERIQVASKRAAEVLYPVPVALEEVQEELEPADAYVIYSLVGDEALALVVEPEGARIVRLGSIEPIQSAAGFDFDDPRQDPTQAVAALRTLLVEPLHLATATRRLLVSPDGVLGYVPFGLLAGERDVAYVPSAGAYRVLRQDRALSGRGVLALGDPDYRWEVAKPASIAERGGMRLVTLPSTREEVRRVGDVVLLGKDATPSGFLAAVKTRARWEAVHLACHGLVDTENAMHSALALAFDADGSNLLVCADVFQLRIPADLAVLSACETGRGAITTGEGILGMTRAFMLAGAPRVLVSLWRVDDAATQALMVEFYRRWRPRDGAPRESAASALRHAQEHVRAQARWRHPYYWAAWVLWGLPD